MSQPTSILRVWTTRQDHDSEEVFLGSPAIGEEPSEGTRSHCVMMLTGYCPVNRETENKELSEDESHVGHGRQAQVSLPCLEVSHC